MNPLQHPSELKDYYQDTRVVGDYMRKRTTQPLGSVMHREQVRFLNHVIAERKPHFVLEVAPGPARLTAEVMQVPFGVAAEFSPAMISAARVRLESAGRRWQIVRADAFSLPLPGGHFDLVYTLRFLRHFSLAERARLYAEIRRVLRPGGLLVMDAQNRAVRDSGHVERHAVYDELYSAESLRLEVESHGFRLAQLYGVIQHHRLQRRVNRLRAFGLDRLARSVIAALERLPSDNPSTWMVACERQP